MVPSSLDLGVATDIQTDRGIEFEGPSARCGFWVAKHDTDFFTKLVDKDGNGLGFVDGGRELAHGLAHHTGLKTNMAVANFTIDFGTGYQGCYGVDDDEVNCTRVNQLAGDFQTLLPRIWLGEEELINIDTQGCGIGWVQGMLGIDEGCDAAFFLRLRYGMKGYGGLTRRLWSVDFDNPALWIPASTQSNIQSQGT